MNTATVLTDTSRTLLADGSVERVAVAPLAVAPLADPYARWHGHVARVVGAAGSVAAVSAFVGNRVSPIWGTDRAALRRRSRR